MSTSEEQGTRLVPAVCTQCGGQLEVDPGQEAAVCKYCGTPFIVGKAIQNYTVQNARIEHADTVNIHTKGAAESFFGFLGTQMSESRAVRREERREQRAADREIQKGFFKVFGILVAVMFAIGILVFAIQNLRGEPGTEAPGTQTPTEETGGLSPFTSAGDSVSGVQDEQAP